MAGPLVLLSATGLFYSLLVKKSVLAGVLNVGMSFWLAFKVALRSRGVRVHDRSRIGQALRRRLLRHPLSFIWPPRD